MDDDAQRHDGYYHPPDLLFYATPGTNVRVRRHIRVGAPPRRAPPYYSGPEPDDFYRSTATWEAPQITATYRRTSREARAAASEAIAALPEVTAGHGEECAICLKDFRAGESLRAMPCSHAFHQQCITEWLGRNAVCPLCRHPLPAAAVTTDEEVEDELEEEDGGVGGGESG